MVWVVADGGGPWRGGSVDLSCSAAAAFASASPVVNGTGGFFCGTVGVFAAVLPLPAAPPNGSLCDTVAPLKVLDRRISAGDTPNVNAVDAVRAKGRAPLTILDADVALLGNVPSGALATAAALGGLPAGAMWKLPFGVKSTAVAAPWEVKECSATVKEGGVDDGDDAEAAGELAVDALPAAMVKAIAALVSLDGCDAEGLFGAIV